METSHPPLWHVTLVLALATLLRAAVAWTSMGDLQRDTDGYRELAVNLRQTGILGWKDSHAATGLRPTAFRPPLYPVVLSALVADGQLAPRSVAGLHLIVGIATVALAYAVAQRWGLGRWSVLVALLVAVDPILLKQSTQLMTETLATFLAMASLFALTCCSARPSVVTCVAAGATLGLSSLCRPTFLPWLVLSACEICFSGRASARRAVHTVAFVVGATALLIPWAARNYHRFGHSLVTTTHGGYTLLLGNNPSFYQFLRTGPWGTVWHSHELDRAWQRRNLAPQANDPRWLNLALANLPDPMPSHQAARDWEFADDELAYALARRYVREQPGMFAYACTVRLGRFWGLMPHAVTASESAAGRFARYAVAVWYLAVFGLALKGMHGVGWNLMRGPWRPGVLLCLAFTAVHCCYWTDLRMRAPVTPFVAILAAAGAASLTQRVGRP